jgi:hypothetical protein
MGVTFSVTVMDDRLLEDEQTREWLASYEIEIPPNVQPGRWRTVYGIMEKILYSLYRDD